MPPDRLQMQQLYTSNVSVNIGEALEARVKDPLWFLTRQWQSGEFGAENGGRPAYLSLSWREFPLTTAGIGSQTTALNLDQPLELVVEQEDAHGDAPAWRSAALEYAFDVQTAAHRFTAQEYHGRRLDWYHFDYAGPIIAASPAIQSQRITPTQLHVRGAPHPRWWRFEDGEAGFDSPEDPEPNVLSTLLPEFFFLDVNNWYVAPLPGRAGTLRELTEVVMVDSFGVATRLNPAGSDAAGGQWRLFGADLAEGVSGTHLDGRFLLMPNVALDVLHNDDVEDVRFLRDEEANLVWAYEHRYRLADGTTVVNGDRAPATDGTDGTASSGAGNETGTGTSAGTGTASTAGNATGTPEDGLPRFVLRSETQPHWIPYVPRLTGTQNAVNGQIYLRRARSVETASRASPQYHSRIVTESWRLNEEEVSPSGLRVRRIARYARGSDGRAYHWIGRQREPGRHLTHPDLRFDYLEDSP